MILVGLNELDRGPMTIGTSRPGSEDAEDVAILERARADIRSTRAHFNHAGMSLTPTPVLARVHAHLDLEAEIGGYEAAIAVADELAQVPGQVAGLLGARPDEVIVTESATAASEVVVWAMAETFRYSDRDRILVDRFAYATAYSTLRRLEAARGVTVVEIPSQAEGTIAPDALERMLDERTRLVLVTHMPTHVGTVTDAVEVGRILSGQGAVFVLDVAQTLGQLPIDVDAIGCGVAFAPGRKFVRGPRGTGVLYVRSALANQLVPLTPTFDSVDPARPGSFTLPAGARRFDQFEHCFAAHLGLGVAARYANEIGLERIARWVAERSRAVIELLRARPAVRLVGDEGSRGIISFVHDSLDPRDICTRLTALGVNSWVNVPAGAPLDATARPVLPSVRLSPHYVTSDDELDRLDRALRTLP